ncbi:hypothetical protein [uncultured Dokdonia sp.]|uniref:hypothetical protein n=1 Tax=Dokdonia sp. R78006 TaxID=3093866 RepID=UPI0026289198|nr:hypothetical protein [uncultured Dokdonia sp.]
MKYALKFTLIFITIISCTKKSVDDNYIFFEDKLELENLSLQEFDLWYPSHSDKQKAKLIIDKSITAYKINPEVPTQYKMKSKYYYQLVPYVLTNGDKVFYVNALCESFVNNPVPNFEDPQPEQVSLQNGILKVDDGGICFWNMTINIDKMSYSNFKSNAF